MAAREKYGSDDYSREIQEEKLTKRYETEVTYNVTLSTTGILLNYWVPSVWKSLVWRERQIWWMGIRHSKKDTINEIKQVNLKVGIFLNTERMHFRECSFLVNDPNYCVGLLIINQETNPEFILLNYRKWNISADWENTLIKPHTKAISW